MKLKSGRTVIEYLERNGSTFVAVKGPRPEMTKEEAAEYHAYVRSLNLEQSRAHGWPIAGRNGRHDTPH